VALAEEGLLNSDDGGKIVLDAAWQDMLNHATAKVCLSVCHIVFHHTLALHYDIYTVS